MGPDPPAPPPEGSSSGASRAVRRAAGAVGDSARAVGAAGAETRRYGKTAGMLGVAVGSAGFLTYVFFALASHNLDRTEYGELVVMWSAVFVTVVTLYRPVEQLLSRTLAEREARHESLREPLRVAAVIQLGLALLFVTAALVFRGALEGDPGGAGESPSGLLSGNSTLYWILIGAVLAYSAGFFARGFFAGTRRFAAYSILHFFESVVRVSFPLAVAVGFATGQTAIALGVVSGPLLSLAVVPLVAGRRFARADSPAPSAPDAAPGKAVAEVGFSLAHGGGFAAAVLLIMLSEQTLMNAGVLYVNLTETAAAAGFIFNVLMVARAPLVLFQAVATSLLPHLTRLRSTGRETGQEAFRMSVRMTLVLVAGFALLVALVVLVAGPELMQIAFGEKFEYERADLLIVTAGMGLYLAAVTLNQAALAQGQVRRAAACYVAAAASFVAWILLPVMDVFRRVEVGFALSALLLCVLLLWLYRRPHPRAEDVLVPGSPQELEARLAAADEAT